MRHARRLAVLAACVLGGRAVHADVLPPPACSPGTHDEYLYGHHCVPDGSHAVVGPNGGVIFESPRLTPSPPSPRPALKGDAGAAPAPLPTASATTAPEASGTGAPPGPTPPPAPPAAPPTPAKSSGCSAAPGGTSSPAAWLAAATLAFGLALGRRRPGRAARRDLT